MEQADAKGPSRYQYTMRELVSLMEEMQRVFDVVRLVEPGKGIQWTLGESGGLQEGEYRCWSIWQKESRCGHCISRRAVMLKKRVTKFEFAHDDLHHVIAKYVEVDGKPYSLELVSRIPDETMMEGQGRRDIVEIITRHNKRVYSDPLTGAFNRRYLDEMFQGWESGRAVAMIDIDDFKRVNDTYGHGVGDQAIKGLVEAIGSCVRSADAIIRYGGDEFVILFDGMPKDKLRDKLEQIRQHVTEIEFADVPALHLTASIGGVRGDGSVKELIDRADKMLYRAKDTGKNSVCIEGENG